MNAPYQDWEGVWILHDGMGFWIMFSIGIVGDGTGSYIDTSCTLFLLYLLFIFSKVPRLLFCFGLFYLFQMLIYLTKFQFRYPTT